MHQHVDVSRLSHQLIALSHEIHNLSLSSRNWSRLLVVDKTIALYDDVAYEEEEDVILRHTYLLRPLLWWVHTASSWFDRPSSNPSPPPRPPLLHTPPLSSSRNDRQSQLTIEHRQERGERPEYETYLRVGGGALILELWCRFVWCRHTIHCFLLHFPREEFPSKDPEIEEGEREEGEGGRGEGVKVAEKGYDADVDADIRRELTIDEAENCGELRGFLTSLFYAHTEIRAQHIHTSHTQHAHSPCGITFHIPFSSLSFSFFS